MKLSFKRITSSGSFIPEIDGLRFIAVASVVLYHFWCFFNVKDLHHYKDAVDYSFLTRILSHGNFGVPLFFVISGFILGVPFARYHIANENKVILKKYFLRRLTRLEPPYIITMTLMLIGAVYFAHKFSLADGLSSYFASVFYIHNFVYPGIFPKLNAVAWSLEIEVQFYFLAPLLAYIFSIKSAHIRRTSIICVSLLFLVINNFTSLPFISLLNYLQYFLIGFLLSDLYVSKHLILPKTRFDSLLGVFFLSVVWLFESGEYSDYQNFIWESFQVFCIFMLYYYVLFHKIFKVLTWPVITNIGGMCYTIYLIHYPIISAVGNPLMSYSFSEYSFVNVFIYSLILLFAIAILAAVFFLFIERPCMDKDWYKRIFKFQMQKMS